MHTQKKALGLVALDLILAVTVWYWIAKLGHRWQHEWLEIGAVVLLLVILGCTLWRVWRLLFSGHDSD